MAVLRPVKLEITNYPAGKPKNMKLKTTPNGPRTAQENQLFT
jgi:hypothetical protein